MITFSSLWAKLKNRKYRRAFATTQVQRGVPFQIKALRTAFGWTQQELAERSGLPQGTISRAENLNYGGDRLGLSTILQIAEGFDVAVIVKFVPFSELARWHTALADVSFRLPTFEEEDRMAQRQTEQGAVGVIARAGVERTHESHFIDRRGPRRARTSVPGVGSVAVN